MAALQANGFRDKPKFAKVSQLHGLTL